MPAIVQLYEFLMIIVAASSVYGFVVFVKLAKKLQTALDIYLSSNKEK